ncbi:HesA/MoeB/ThiF family protein [Streptomyces sp. NPDC059443]|uniref:HesA/MoeB/ThiF family protein n=1 Tax=unclassified Streptomyces TaxID=2593676 RepID=UPI00369613F8
MPKPSLKSTIPSFKDESGINFRMAGEILTLEDPDGIVADLVGLLDGSRETTGVFTELTGRHPEVTREEFDQALADLDDARLLHDVDASHEGLTDYDLERWSRSLGFFETYATLDRSKYAFQRGIRDTKVAMLGVGGVGSHVLMDLVAMGFRDIRIVDFDTVELSNLNRQVLYGEQYIGRSKIERAAAWVKGYNSDVTLHTLEKKLMSADDVYEAVHDRDIVVAAIDRPKTRALTWLNEGCLRAGAALITGGVDTQRAVHFTILPGVSGCVACWKSAAHAADATSRDIYLQQRTEEDAGLRFGEDMAAFDGLVALQTAFLVGELIRLATGVSTPLSVGRMLQVTFQTPVLAERETWQRDPDCPTCKGVIAQPRFAALRDALTPAPPLVQQGAWPND